MHKPEQYKTLAKHPDNIDLLSELESAMDSIASAMNSLAGYEAFTDYFDALSDLWDDMKPQYDEYEAIDAAEYRKEMDGLNRQYLRSVM